MAQYYVYIMTNASRTPYIGVTNDLLKRVYEHKCKLTGGFTKKYNVTWLAYHEVTGDVSAALTREKQLKKWSRGKKVARNARAKPNRCASPISWASGR